MTFDEEVKKARKKQLQSRITRDIIFMLLGLTFLAISFFSTVKKNNDKKVTNQTTTVIKK